jgi:oligopeptide/dipeptide ABC transporter ATP-binding protein
VSPPLLTVEQLVVEYPTPDGALRAVDRVDLEVQRGETLALVGESGCGKSTLGRAITRLLPVKSGRVVFDGVDLLTLRGRALRAARRRFQIVFQDPGAALNERMTVGDLVGEPLVVHRVGGRTERQARVAEVLELVGLEPSAAAYYPHQFSGGQRQRIAIARALALEPELLVADEPTSSLDVSIQGQILLLLMELRVRLGLSILLISHDLAVVRALADRIAVMYLGQVVEVAGRSALYEEPRHPYTGALLVSAPRMGAERWAVAVQGEVPSALRPPSGCRFRTRCPIAIERCAEEAPRLRALGPTLVACHRAEEAVAVELLMPPRKGAAA